MASAEPARIVSFFSEILHSSHHLLQLFLGALSLPSMGLAVPSWTLFIAAPASFTTEQWPWDLSTRFLEMTGVSLMLPVAAFLTGSSDVISEQVGWHRHFKHK